MKRRFEAIVDKFRRKKWPWVVSGLVILVVIGGVLGDGGDRQDLAAQREKAAIAKAEAKASKEAAKKEEKERKKQERREEKERKKQERREAEDRKRQKAQKEQEPVDEEVPARNEEEDKRRQKEERSKIPGPNAGTEEMRLKWFNDMWVERSETPNFASYCELERLDGLSGSWACRATKVGSFSTGGYEIYTDAVKGKRKTSERADAEKLADSVIRGICASFYDDAKTLKDVYILVRDYSGDNISQKTCSALPGYGY